MKKIFFFTIVCFLFFSGIAARTITDSLLFELQRHPREDTLRLHYLNQLSYQLATQNTQKSLEFATQALQLSKRLGSQKWLARTFAFAGFAYVRAGQRSIAINHLIQALSMLRRQGRKANVRDQVFVLTNLALINFNHAPRESLRYLQMSVDVALSAAQIQELSGLYNNMGVIYNEKFNIIDTAILFFEKSISYIDKKKPDSYGLALAKLNLADLYLKNEQIEAAQRYLAESKSEMANSSDLVHRSNWFFTFAKLAYQKEDYKTAQKACQQALTIAHSYDQGQTYLPEYLFFYADLLNQMHRYDSIYHYVLEAADWSAKNSAKMDTETISRIETQYKVKEKTQQNLLLQAQNRQYQYKQYFYLLLIVFFVLILFGTILVNRRLKRQQLQIESQKLDLASFNEKLRASLSQVQKLVEEKRQVVSTLAHDLRTPLQSIQIKANILGLHSQHLDVATEIQRAAQRIHQTTLRIVEVENQEQIAVQKSLGPVLIYPCLRQVIAHFSAIASAKQVNIELPPLNQDLIVVAEPQLLEHIFDNLLSNAIKFSPRLGTVAIQVSQNQGAISVAFSDQGDGIPQSIQSGLFKAHAPNLDALKPGLGIGLSICKRYAELMGGDLLISSSVEGTNVQLLLTAA